MKKYSIINIPLGSLFQKDLYRDVCHEWKGTGFGYLLLLLAVCWLGPIIQVHMVFGKFVDNEVPKIVSQVPVITITDGKASIEEPQPYYIKDPDKGENIFAIDTTGGLTSLEDAGTMGLLTETAVIYKKNDIETQTFNLNEVKEFTLDQEKIEGWLAWGKKWVAPIFYALALLFSYIGRIIQLLIYAAIGLLFASWCNSKRTYGQLLRLSAVAVTPVIIIKTILTMLPITVPFAWLVFFLSAMGLLYFGVKVSAEEGPTGASTIAPPLG